MSRMVLTAIIYALSTVSLSAAAQDASKTTTKDSQTALKIEDAADRKNKVDGDLDEEITNAKLRAESGSKSKWSMSINGKYTGGSVNCPFGTERPVLSADPSVQSFTTLDFGVNARYRWNKNDSVTGGTAFGFVTPFEGRVTPRDAINVNDPVVGYNHVTKFWGLQTAAAVSYAYGTSISSRDADLTHQVGLSYNVMKQLENKFSFGASASTYYNAYSTDAGDGHDQVTTHSSQYGHDKRLEYGLGVFPQAEYAFTDKFSARTVFGYFNWKHLYGDPRSGRLLQTYVYQSIGIGWAVARDVYLYPNVQFVPDNIRSDFTNVSLTTTINIF